MRKLSLLFVVCLASCASAPTPAATSLATPSLITLDADVTRIEGWFWNSYEWMIFPNSNIAGYYPFASDERMRCVSMLNDTGRDPAEFESLVRRKVRATGYVVEFSKLESSPNTGAFYEGKKYFKEREVLNSCLRASVFVAKSVDSVG